MQILLRVVLVRPAALTTSVVSVPGQPKAAACQRKRLRLVRFPSKRNARKLRLDGNRALLLAVYRQLTAELLALLYASFSTQCCQ